MVGAGTGLLETYVTGARSAHSPPWLTFGGRAQNRAENAVHRRARARVEHALSRLKDWKILRGCRPKGDGGHQAMLGIIRLHNLALTG
jgi:hypothetical protein